MRSFSNLWYWIMLAVLWSSTSHWVLGVPHDLFLRARRHGGQAAEDYETMLRINVSRLLTIARTSGLWLVVFGSAMLSGLAMAAFWYQIEFAQALFCFALPMTLVAALALRTANRLERDRPSGDALYRVIMRHRMGTQVVGVISIFLTGMYGMWQNLSIGVLH